MREYNFRMSLFDKLLQLFRRATRRIGKTVAAWFFLDQWVILTTAISELDALAWPNFNPLVPPPDRYWADPFVVSRNGMYYIFIEEKIYRQRRGRIACLTLDSNARLLSSEPVLERPYHLSYPFLFEYGEQLYMLPESAENRSLDVYRCTHFPTRWEFVQTLMSDIYIVDATLLQHHGKWWLFANVKENQDRSSLDRLFIYYADTPLTDDWTPHPANPVVDDIRRARPAGTIFTHQGHLIRPSQDSLIRYGGALNFNRITKLSPTEYAEVLEKRFEPPPGRRILATHTFNRSDRLAVLDAVIRRRKPQ